MSVIDEDGEVALIDRSYLPRQRSLIGLVDFAAKTARVVQVDHLYGSSSSAFCG